MRDNKEVFDKMLDASSNIIWDELRKIRESNPMKKESIKRRWVWELIQNALDCVIEGKKIDIEIKYYDNILTFIHNGNPFTYNNLLDLITQISRKQRMDEGKIGKFGTGFMSTHLLSEIVNISGSFIDNNGDYKELDFNLDRSGYEYDEIRMKTDDMLNRLDEINNSPINSQDKIKSTTFTYTINDDTRDDVEKAIEDLKKIISYLLAFNSQVNSITYNNERHEVDKINYNKVNDTSNLKTFTIKSSDSITKLLIFHNEEVSIGTLYEKDDDKIKFLRVPGDMPKLFCELPLLGTEKFSFPIIINSSFFEVERDRNGIRDGNESNMKLMKQAVNLYKDLVNYFMELEISENEYNICLLDRPHDSDIQDNVYKEVRKFIENSEIIPVYDSLGIFNRMSIKDKDDEVQIKIPDVKNQENCDLFWNIVSQLECITIPSKETYHGWKNVVNNDVKFMWINNEILRNVDIQELQDILTSGVDVYEWLNNLYSLWIRDENFEKVFRKVYVPNQQGEFIRINSIYFDQEIDSDLKSISDLLSLNIYEELLDKNINVFDSYFTENSRRIKDNNDCAKAIEKETLQILAKESINGENRKSNTQEIFNKLTNWFLKNKTNAEVIFGNLYTKRIHLSSLEENLRRYEIAEKIDENHIKSDELDEMIKNYEVIKSIIYNNELDDEEIIRQLKHESISTKEMKEYVNNLLNRSRNNVYNYLKDLDDYILPDSFEMWLKEKYSDTVFPAKYNGKDIRIIVRPSDNQKIIFYNDEELEALDDEDYHLWTDDGALQRMVTLGDILKTTGISKIPLRKL